MEQRASLFFILTYKIPFSSLWGSKIDFIPVILSTIFIVKFDISFESPQTIPIRY